MYITQYAPGIPIEVSPFAYAPLLKTLKTRLACPRAALRMAPGGKAGPVVSDNGNFVIDAPFEKDDERWKDPPVVRVSGLLQSVWVCCSCFLGCTQLLKELKLLTGVVEVGLFCGIAKAAYFGNRVRTIRSQYQLRTFHRSIVLAPNTVVDHRTEA